MEFSVFWTRKPWREFLVGYNLGVQSGAVVSLQHIVWCGGQALMKLISTLYTLGAVAVTCSVPCCCAVFICAMILVLSKCSPENLLPNICRQLCPAQRFSWTQPKTPNFVASSSRSRIPLPTSSVSRVSFDIRNLTSEIDENLSFDGLCTPECRQSLLATGTLKQHLQTYFNALGALGGVMMLLMLIESILVCISCCSWRKKYTTVTTTTQPEVMMAQVVETQVVEVETAAPAPKVESP